MSIKRAYLAFPSRMQVTREVSARSKIFNELRSVGLQVFFAGTSFCPFSSLCWSEFPLLVICHLVVQTFQHERLQYEHLGTVLVSYALALPHDCFTFVTGLRCCTSEIGSFSRHKD